MTFTPFLLQAGAPPAGPAPSAGPPPSTTATTTATTGVATGQTGQTGGQPGGLQGQLMTFGPMIGIFVVFYFLLIRPQQKKQRELQDWIKSIKKGDEVVTTGGLIGKISGLTDHVVTLELQEKVRVKVLRSHVAGKAPAAGEAGPMPQKNAS